MKYRHLVSAAGFVWLMVCAIEVDGQSLLNFEFGVRSGVPFNDSFSYRLTGTASAFSSSSFVKPKLSAGPSIGVIFHDEIGIEFDAIYQPVKIFDTSRTGPVTQSTTITRGSSWEFPIMANYRWGGRPIRPFGGGGIVVASRLAGTNETRTRDLQTGVV